MYHTLNREYDPNTGRFTTLDPREFSAGQSNLYEYVGNNPTNATDPTGLQAQGPTFPMTDREWDEYLKKFPKGPAQALRELLPIQVHNDDTISTKIPVPNGEISINHNNISGEITDKNITAKFGNGKFSLTGRLPHGGSYTFENNKLKAIVKGAKGTVVSIDSEGSVTGKIVGADVIGGNDVPIDKSTTGLFSLPNSGFVQVTRGKFEAASLAFERQNIAVTKTQQGLIASLTTQSGDSVAYNVNSRVLSFTLVKRAVGYLEFQAGPKNVGVTAAFRIAHSAGARGRVSTPVTFDAWLTGNITAAPRGTTYDIKLCGSFVW